MEWCSSVRGVSHGPPPSRVPLPSRVRAGLISDASASPQNAACALVRARLLSDRPAPAERAACGPVCAHVSASTTLVDYLRAALASSWAGRDIVGNGRG